MATKSVVCPECGAAAAPGRYACAECGALLASVGPVRSWSGEDAAAPAPAPSAPPPVAVAEEPAKPARRSGSRTRRPTAAEAPAPAVVERPVAQPVAQANAVQPQPPTQPAAPSWPQPVTGATAAAMVGLERETGSRTPAYMPRRNPALPPFAAAPAPSLPAIEASESLEPIDEDAPLQALAPLDDAEIEARRASLAPLAPTAPTAPAWPPPGDRGPVPMPVERAPAGAYLAPSAVLAPVDVAAAPTNGHRPPPTGNRVTPAVEAAAAPRRSLAESLETFGITAEMPRKLAGVGAAVAALGFFLPWRNSVFGGDVIDDYLTHWGLAGPGNWVAVALLLGLLAMALTSGRLARVPIGVPAIALATLIVGLLWPSLFGAASKPVGVWIVLAGALLLVVGGVLASRRHEPVRPPV